MKITMTTTIENNAIYETCLCLFVCLLAFFGSVETVGQINRLFAGDFKARFEDQHLSNIVFN